MKKEYNVNMKCSIIKILFSLIAIVVFSTGCSRKSSNSENNEIDKLLDFVENATDDQFLNFLGNMGY